MRCRSSCCILRCWSLQHPAIGLYQIRHVGPVNRVDSVVDCRVQDGEISCRMNGCRLGSSSADDHEERLVPLHYLVAKLCGPTGTCKWRDVCVSNGTRFRFLHDFWRGGWKSVV